MKVIQNEHGYYEVRFKGQNGKTKTISTHRKNKKDAAAVISKAKIRELELAAELGALTPSVMSLLTSGKRMTVEQAIEPWKQWLAGRHRSPNTINNSELWVRAWAIATNTLRKPLLSVTAEDLDPWINSTGSTNSMGTRMVMLSALKSFFSYASARGWCTGNPAELASVDPFLLQHEQKETYKQPCFEEEEVLCLLDITSPNGERPSTFWHAAIAISRYTGLRLGDIACLEWACLSRPGYISVWTQKRDRRVELPLTPDELKHAILDVSKVDYQFLFPEQREIIRDPKRRALLSNQFSRLCQACWIEGKSFHGLRATAATDMAERGIPMEDIADILGHAYLETTRGYIRP